MERTRNFAKCNIAGGWEKCDSSATKTVRHYFPFPFFYNNIPKEVFQWTLLQGDSFCRIKTTKATRANRQSQIVAELYPKTSDFDLHTHKRRYNLCTV